MCFHSDLCDQRFLPARTRRVHRRVIVTLPFLSRITNVVSNNKWTFGAVVEHSIHDTDAFRIVMSPLIRSHAVLFPPTAAVLVCEFRVFVCLKNHRIKLLCIPAVES